MPYFLLVCLLIHRVKVRPVNTQSGFKEHLFAFKFLNNKLWPGFTDTA